MLSQSNKSNLIDLVHLNLIKLVKSFNELFSVRLTSFRLI